GPPYCGRTTFGGQQRASERPKIRALRVGHPSLSGPRQTAGVAGTKVPRRVAVRHVGRTCQPLSFGEACRADVEHRRKRRESRAIRTGLWLRIGTLRRTCEYLIESGCILDGRSAAG